HANHTRRDPLRLRNLDSCRISADIATYGNLCTLRPMSAVGRREVHLSHVILWEYRNSPHVLTQAELVHLSNCNNCLSLLGLSLIAKNFAHLERLVKEHDDPR